MSVGLVVVIIVLAVLVALVVLGALGNRRHHGSRHERFHISLRAVDRALAHAHAEDRGWDRAALEAAARRELTDQRPGVAVLELHLVQVLDRPGTDADQAVFEVRTAAGESRLTLGRREREWVLVALSDARPPPAP